MELLALLGIAFSSIMVLLGATAFCVTRKIGCLIVTIILCLIDGWFIKKENEIKSGITAQMKVLKREASVRGKKTGRERKELLKRMMSVNHQEGLPLAQNAPCFIVKEDDYFQVSGGGNDFILKKEKITDICVKTDVKIQKQKVSNTGGAIIGAIFLGPLGALIGGRGQEIQSKNTTYYLIFSYISEEKISYISFSILAGGLERARKWEKEFRKEANDKRNIIEI